MSLVRVKLGEPCKTNHLGLSLERLPVWQALTVSADVRRLAPICFAMGVQIEARLGATVIVDGARSCTR